VCRRMRWVEATGGAGKGRGGKEAGEGRRGENGAKVTKRESESGKCGHTQTHVITCTDMNIHTHIHTCSLTHTHTICIYLRTTKHLSRAC